MVRARTRPVFTPEWDGVIKNWAINFIRRNKWRCDSIHGIDDLLQDAYLVFVKVADTYPRVMEARNFMALFKTAMGNKFHDHARYTQRKRTSCVETSTDVSDFFSDRIGEVTNGGYLGALLAEAPDEVRYALNAFTDESVLVALRQQRRKDKRKLRPRENLNMRLQRVTGAAAGTDLVGAIKALLM